MKLNDDAKVQSLEVDQAVFDLFQPERRVRREAASALQRAISSDCTTAFFDALRALELSGGLDFAFGRIARGTKAGTKVQGAMLQAWLEQGDLIRSLFDRDLRLIDGLRILLREYDGPAVTLYRGESRIGRRHRTYGLSWTTEIEVARAFACGARQSMPGGSVLLKVTASAPAIICAPSEIDNRFKEGEFLVDRRQLSDVVVIQRFEQRRFCKNG